MPRKLGRQRYVEYTFKDGVKRGPGNKTATPFKIKESLSSNGLTKYLTILWSDDVLTCDCPGWTILKKDSAGNKKPRTCKHCKQAVSRIYGDMVAVRADAAGTQLGERATRNIRIRGNR